MPQVKSTFLRVPQAGVEEQVGFPVCAPPRRPPRQVAIGAPGMFLEPVVEGELKRAAFRRSVPSGLPSNSSMHPILIAAYMPASTSARLSANWIAFSAMARACPPSSEAVAKWERLQ